MGKKSGDRKEPGQVKEHVRTWVALLLETPRRFRTSGEE
jgi:hypothetical protein